MTVPVADIVDVDALWKTVVASFVAAVGIVILFSFAILGTERARQCWADDRAGEAIAWGALAAIGLLGTVAAIVIGLVIVASK